MISVASAASRFLSWWSGQLAACMPAHVCALLRRKSSTLVIIPAGDAAEFVLHRNGRTRRLGRLPRATNLARGRALTDHFGGALTRFRDVAVSVPPDQVLRRRVVLPLEAAENLREVLAFEMDRHTPFRAADVVYDHRIAATDIAARKIIVDLAVLPRTILQRAAAIAGSFGLSADRVGIVDDDSAPERLFDVRSGEDSGSSPGGQRLLIALMTATAVLAAVAWYLPVYFDHRTSAAYEARLEETRTAALQAEDLKKRLATAMDLDRILVDRRTAVPTMTRVLAEITDRLPDGTWLTQLQLHDGQLTITGFSRSAAPLIAQLQASPLLTDVHFGSPVTPDPQAGAESFNILAQVAPDRGS
jgi:general secretion pathway protein L